MLKSYQYRIYPTKSQVTALNNTLDICRKVYNNTLALKKTFWEYDQKSLTYFDTANELVTWKKEYPYLKQVHSQVLQNVQVRVDLAFKSFFRRVKSGETPGYPRFKSIGRYSSITYPQSGYKITNNVVELSKIGKIKTIFHRTIEGKIKTVSVRKTSTNKWYLSISCEEVPVRYLTESEKCIGIDVGIKTFAVFSNNEYISNPKFYQKEEKELSKKQRKLSLCNENSYNKNKKVVSRIHERIRTKREDFVQKLSRSIINNYGIICFEDLSINKMVKNHIYSKGILDAAWNKLVQYTKYKAEEAGRIVVLVNPKNTSQICSKCGNIVIKDISVRTHECPFCGYTADRDLNAAINILRLGTQSLSTRTRSPTL